MEAFYTQQKLIDQGWAPAMARGVAGLIVEQGLAGRVSGDPMSYLARTPSTIDVQPPSVQESSQQRSETFSCSLQAADEKGSGWGAKVGRMLTVTRKIVKKKSRLHVCEVFQQATS
ncbi:hypothetical protein AURDEDRAFT_113546 [Auricularia subglabra TFB-10046 SS5]|nr:hypothetical protein AURDEDRAFT_113546 [Auricularia subglabra TFB-10046 SS5]